MEQVALSEIENYLKKTEQIIMGFFVKENKYNKLTLVVITQKNNRFSVGSDMNDEKGIRYKIDQILKIKKNMG